MKKMIRIIGTILTVIKFSTASATIEDPYLSDNILGPVQDISISKLIEFKKISIAIDDEFDKARFHYIIAYEIDRRKQALDQKFYEREQKYQKAIISYENELGLTPYQYADERPRFDYVYQIANITDETIVNDIHRVQAELARTQFIQLYQYYKRRMDIIKIILLRSENYINVKFKIMQMIKLHIIRIFKKCIRGSSYFITQWMML